MNLHLCTAASFGLNQQVGRFSLNKQLTLTTLGVVCWLQFLVAAATPAFDRRGTGTKEQLALMGNDLCFNEVSRAAAAISERIEANKEETESW